MGGQREAAGAEVGGSLAWPTGPPAASTPPLSRSYVEEKFRDKRNQITKKVRAAIPKWLGRAKLHKASPFNKDGTFNAASAKELADGAPRALGRSRLVPRASMYCWWARAVTAGHTQAHPSRPRRTPPPP